MNEYIPLQDITHPQATPVRQLHVASLVAHVRPTHLSRLRGWLQQKHANISAEIHAESDQGKLVIVIEGEAEKNIAAFLDELRDQSGVLNAALVYHQYLSADDLQDELSNEGRQ